MTAVRPEYIAAYYDIRRKLTPDAPLTPHNEADAALLRLTAEVQRYVADWIEQHDPADELTWFIDSLREGLAAHKPCKHCWTPKEEQS